MCMYSNTLVLLLFQYMNWQVSWILYVSLASQPLSFRYFISWYPLCRDVRCCIYRFQFLDFCPFGFEPWAASQETHERYQDLNQPRVISTFTSWCTLYTKVAVTQVRLGDPEVTANMYCKSRNLPNTDTQNYSTDLR